MVKFGTSGLRGPVTDLTADVVIAHTQAFLQVVPHSNRLLIGRDLRDSSPEIACNVAEAARRLGVTPVDCRVLPTPALALAAAVQDTPAIMVTGSHIPGDRNGLKFYRATGEITKADERDISAAIKDLPPLAHLFPPNTGVYAEAGADYLKRYLDFYIGAPLSGLRIGVYQHSSVARDLMVTLFEALGADVVPLGRADTFVPVDTEAVDLATRGLLQAWASEDMLDAIVSTDGDADRPMLTDHHGHVIPGDILGILAARALGATHVVTPVSSSTVAERLGAFETVERTRIGSPFVIAGMQDMPLKDADRVAGFEANGGFLLGFEANRGPRRIAPLMTRDFALPVLAALVAAQEAGTSLANLVAELPRRFTASDRLTRIAPDIAQQIVDRLVDAPGEILPGDDEVVATDTTDGARLTLNSGRIVHVRPSGNAPELRCYVEDASRQAVTECLERMLDLLREAAVQTVAAAQ